MTFDNIELDDLVSLQIAANDTMTRVLFIETEVVGNVASTRLLLVEPLSVEVTVDA